jgi:hypothetical protein
MAAKIARRKTISKHSKDDLTIEIVNELRKAAASFGKESAVEKMQLLSLFPQKKIKNAKGLIAYHDCLLYLLAYPENKELYKQTLLALEQVREYIRYFFNGKNQHLRTQLTGTGLAYTSINVAFSFDMVKWLADRFGNGIRIFECGADNERIMEVFSLLLPKAELESFKEGSPSFKKIVKKLNGKGDSTDVKWLIDLFDSLSVELTLRDQLYDSLKIYISWTFDEGVPSTTDARALPGNIFYHSHGLIRSVDASRLIHEPVPRPVKISDKEKDHLVTAAKGILCMMLRETDPVTYADVHAVEYFEMGRGITIALYPMVHNRRLPFDSYIGYVAFKNQLPVAYGGGWIFQRRSKIGINIFEPYRGGESLYLFTQILRLYHSRYSVNRFIIEPYQIGKKNIEGLKSGAFWFYYRLGFQSQNNQLQQLAVKEFARIQENRSYRSSIDIMKQLAQSSMELRLSDVLDNDLDVSTVSDIISEHIENNFNGNRKNAIATAIDFAKNFIGLDKIQKLQGTTRQVTENFSLLLSILPALDQWNVKDKAALLSVILEKGEGSEWKYIREFQSHKKLNNGLAKLLQAKAEGQVPA